MTAVELSVNEQIQLQKGHDEERISQTKKRDKHIMWVVSILSVVINVLIAVFKSVV